MATPMSLLKFKTKCLLTSTNPASRVCIGRSFTLCFARQQKKKSKPIKNGLDDFVSSISGTPQHPRPSERKDVASSRTVKVRSSQSPLSDTDDSSSFIQFNLAKPFKQILKERHKEATRSVIVRTQSPEHTLERLQAFGSIRHAHFTSPEKACVLVEYADQDSVARLQSKASFFIEPNQFPMRSRLFFDTSQKSTRMVPKINLSQPNWADKSSHAFPALATLDEELNNLSRCRLLSEDDLRSRFLVCLQLEELLQSFLPEAHVLPYGSCMNGFGWWDSDLDMMLCYEKDAFLTNKPQELYSRMSSLKVLTEIFSSSRHLAQRTLAMVASLLELTPRIQRVFKILNARVPIVRFKNTIVNMECDISVQQMDSVKMTELLYLYSVCDPRVRPLMTAIKQWAIIQGVTSSGEKQKPTTIGILMMLLFYLQTRTPPVVPTLRQIQSLASTSEMFYIEDIVYGLPSDPAKIPKSRNAQSTGSLLLGFFTFYSEFDFHTKAISIIEGSTFEKCPDSSPVHIENPLCVGLNICRNVSSGQLELFVERMKEAAVRLEDTLGQHTESYSSDQTQLSRLAVLFRRGQSAGSSQSVDLDHLFSADFTRSGNSADEAAGNDLVSENSEEILSDSPELSPVPSQTMESTTASSSPSGQSANPDSSREDSGSTCSPDNRTDLEASPDQVAAVKGTS